MYSDQDDFRCCIDKTSSAELSEAINSMFRWYQNAAVCYAFLSDVPSCMDASAVELNFAKARWFTRGWTLQELIAPENLIFFSMDWHPLGTKSQIHNILSSITGIEKKFLYSKNLELASIAKKMSWAASRRTSRIEDIAYSLLGIFDVNMPLIYGEGKKAFKRLQEEILKTRTDDHSLFAWGTVVSTPSMKIPDLKLYMEREPIERSQNFLRQPLLGLLAESPRDFSSSGGFVPMPWVSNFYRSVLNPASLPLVIDGGVHLQLPLLEAFDSVYHWDKPKIEQIRTAKTIALLCCHETKRDSFVKLPIQRWGFEYFGRSREILMQDDTERFDDNTLFQKSHLITIAAERRINLEIGDLILRRHAYPDLNHCQGIYSVGLGEIVSDDAVIEARKLRAGQRFGYFYSMEGLSRRHGFAILLTRVADAGKPGDSLLAEIFPLDFSSVLEPNTTTNKSRIDDYGLKWWPFQQRLSGMPTHSHTMKTPLDIWNLDTEPFPPMSVRVERMLFDEDESFVDVLDLVIWPLKGSDSQFRRLHALGR
jgi:hypothetical protein